MYLNVVFMPLLMSILSLTFGHFIGRKGVTILIMMGMFVTVMHTFLLFYEVALSSNNCFLKLYTWIDLAYIKIDFGFYFDTITVVMLIIICLISFFVHLYSIEYMNFDVSYNRFLSYLSLFTFFMIWLVVSDNYLQMFMGWEGVGLSSYLLINFWYTRVLANKAAIKAMLVNRVGDLSLLISICIVFFVFGSLKYNIVFSLIIYILNNIIYVYFFKLSVLDLICFFLFLGAMGKSAQLGLHVWLPDAMEGPTPVSALIHAATMVTAGVFLVIRSSFIFEHSSIMLVFVSLVGGFTCLFSSIIGIFQFDIKKIVAYSTCSQLGYMFFSCGVSNYNVALFHLFNHAFFKALLFLSMGSIIHAMSDEQDFRRMGGIIKLMPFTYTMVLIGSIALFGIPFLTGFYSKDMILEFTFSIFHIKAIYIYMLGLFAAFCTSFYSTRLLYWVFISGPNFFKSYIEYIHEPKFPMFFSLLILGLCSIFFGYFFNEAFIGIGSSFWMNSIFNNILTISIFDAEFNLFFVKLLPLISSLLGIILFFFFTLNYFEFFFFLIFKYDIFLFNYKVMSRAFLFDMLYVDFFLLFILNKSYKYIYKYVEKGVFEYIVFYFVIKMFSRIYKLITIFNTGYIYHYIFLIIFFINILLLFIEFISWLNISILMIFLYNFYVSGR